MNHQRKSGAYTKPANWAGTIAPAFLGETQRERVTELVLIVSFGADLLVQWRSLVDPETPIRWAEATRHLMPRRAAREALAELEDGTGAEASTLLAATRWFCSLDLPADRKELWSGPPLFVRRESSDARDELVSRSKISEFVDDLGGKSIPRWCVEHGVSEDALQLVVESFARGESQGAAVISAFRVGVAAGEAASVRGGRSTEAQHLQRGAGRQ